MIRAAAAIIALTLASPTLASTASDALRARATDEIYSLDRDRALETYRQAIAADPQDAAAYRGLATALWLSITFRRGNMTVDDYLGRVSRPSPSPTAPPPPDVVNAFRDALERAIQIARERIAARPNDADAHYQLGAALGVRASYVATVEGSAFGAFRAAKEAYDEHERVLELDRRRKDAGLIVGTYRYIVAALSLPLRWAAYIVGFGGGKERGLGMIEEAAAYPGDNENDARLALILLYNREHRFDDALRELAVMRGKYPRNRLMWLESGATSLRAGRAAAAKQFLDEGIERLATDTRPRMYGEEALWFYKRGAAHRALGRSADAARDLNRSLSLEGRGWVHGRARFELGALAAAAGDTATAREQLGTATRLCDSDNDGATADQARALLKTLK